MPWLMVNFLNCKHYFFFLFSNKILVSMAGTSRMVVRIANREDPDLILHCLSRPFGRQLVQAPR